VFLQQVKVLSDCNRQFAHNIFKQQEVLFFQGDTMKDAISVIKERRSVRTFIQKKIPEKVMRDILDCARLAPSARNIQPWHFIVVQEKETLAKIAGVCTYGPFIKDASACIVVCGEPENPHLVEDGVAATENILLAARAHDIGSCWVAGWKRAYNDGLKNILNAPERIEIVSILALGYTESFPAPKGKKDLKDIVHWEKF
jgi:nitroreductase